MQAAGAAIRATVNAMRLRDQRERTSRPSPSVPRRYQLGARQPGGRQANKQKILRKRIMGASSGANKRRSQRCEPCPGKRKPPRVGTVTTKRHLSHNEAAGSEARRAGRR